MPKERSVASTIFTIVVFILLEIASLLLLSHNNQLQKLWFMRISHGFSAKVWGITQTVNDYFSLKQQNEMLALENGRLTSEVRSLKMALHDIDSTSRPELKENGFFYVPATIVKSTRKSQHNYLILDKGSEDGIRPNSGVITSNGVIGIVDAVSQHYCYAISFENAEVNVSARLGNEGAVGPLSWDGMTSDGAVLKEIPLQYKFNPGDTVYTSGYSSIFPSDIPIGVTGTSKIINGATNEIKVRMFQNQKALRYATIVMNSKLEEIEALEKEENAKIKEGKR
jgi:rod shape-determining protein MreC